jgi:hypothetical protein
MPSQLTIEGKRFGRGNAALFPPFTIPMPDDWSAEVSLRDLIAYVVGVEVTAFNERREARKLIQTLTARQIEEGAEAGKIVMGSRDEDEAAADPAQATVVALQAFEDGLYFAFVDDRQIEDLAEVVTLSASPKLTFLRLVALAGG